MRLPPAKVCVLSQVAGLREALLSRGIGAESFNWLSAGTAAAGLTDISSAEGKAASKLLRRRKERRKRGNKEAMKEERKGEWKE